jgi:hypothetical protein
MSTEAELADSMTAAFRTVCRSVGVTKTGHYATEIVATKIVELAKDGVDDPDELSRRVLRDLNLLEQPGPVVVVSDPSYPVPPVVGQNTRERIGVGF